MSIRHDEEHLHENRYDVLGKIGKVLFVVCIMIVPEGV